MPLLLKAAPPAWWTPNVIDATKQANDYAAVNQGQLKNIAKRAAAELDAHLSGGVGDNVDNLIVSWTTPTPQSNDFAPVNLGMLKNIAKPFYDRLISVGYMNAYPWNSDQSTINNYATANMGQVKNLFSFDLVTATTANDLDNDGIADWWEEYYFPAIYPDNGFDPNAYASQVAGMTILQAFQQGVNPLDFYDGASPMLTLVAGDKQLGLPSSILAKPLKVLISKPDGTPWADAPIVFTSTAGEGFILISGNSSNHASVRSGVDGTASVSFQLPNVLDALCTITAQPVTPMTVEPITFTSRSVADPSIPLAPSGNDVETDASGNVIVTWSGNSDNATSFIIERSSDNQQWQQVGTCPANITSFTDTTAAPNIVYCYRIKAAN